MTAIYPIDGLIVNPARVSKVVSPLYDALTPEERHVFATKNPQNYLNVMRSVEEYADVDRPEPERLLSQNKKALDAMIERGDFRPLPQHCLLVYRLSTRTHCQTGVVCEIPVDEYESGAIKKHEHTQKNKEEDLVSYQKLVRASSSPISLAYAPNLGLNSCIAEVTTELPTIDFVTDDETRQQIWCVDDTTTITKITNHFRSIKISYLTDGHHRAAASVRFRDIERKSNHFHSGCEPYNRFLAALFPTNELQILEYNRCFQGGIALNKDQFLVALRERFSTEFLGEWGARGVKPRIRGEFGLFLDGEWYRMIIKPELVPTHDPVSSLDVSLLQDQVLAPLLGVREPRTDSRLSYLSGAFSLTRFEKHCIEKDLLGFLLYPTEIEDLMRVADLDEIMPPKSTWFEPKLRSGIFLILK